MYGEALPRVVGVAPPLLQDASSFRHVAWCLERVLAKGPVWVVLGAASPLVDARDRRERAEAARHLADDPTWDAPEDAVEATARLLERHLAAAGVRIPRGRRDEAALLPRPVSALLLVGRQGCPAAVAVAAVAVAQDLGVGEADLWRRGPVGLSAAAAAREAGVRLRSGVPGPALLRVRA